MLLMGKDGSVDKNAEVPQLRLDHPASEEGMGHVLLKEVAIDGSHLLYME